MRISQWMRGDAGSTVSFPQDSSAPPIDYDIRYTKSIAPRTTFGLHRCRSSTRCRIPQARQGHGLARTPPAPLLPGEVFHECQYVPSHFYSTKYKTKNGPLVENDGAAAAWQLAAGSFRAQNSCKIQILKFKRIELLSCRLVGSEARAPAALWLPRLGNILLAT